MTTNNENSHRDKTDRDDKREERQNPGMNSEGISGTGADRSRPRDGGAAKKYPLDGSAGEQAGTQRDPKFKTED